MASVTFEHVTQRFGETTAVSELSLEIADGEFMVLVGPSGSGKTTALRLLAGPRAAHRREHPDRRARRRRRRAARARHRDGLPGLRALPADERPPEPRLRPADPQARPRGDRPPRASEAAELLGIEPLLERKPRAAVGRPAPARRARTRARPRPAGVPHGRAALEPRREAARADARRDQAAPARGRHDDGLRDPRPGRGDDDGRPDRDHARRRPRAGRRSRRRLRASRRTPSSRASSAARR